MTVPEHSIFRLRRHIGIMLVVRQAVPLLAGWAFLWGTAVVALRSPEKMGLDVITGIKRGAPVRRVPIVTLGAPELRQAALAAGANDFVATPLYVRDVVTVSRLLALSHAVPNAPHPEVEVQVGTRKVQARARTVTGPERAKLWDKALEFWPPYADYQKKTEREIPVVLLEPVA